MTKMAKFKQQAIKTKAMQPGQLVYIIRVNRAQEKEIDKQLKVAGFDVVNRNMVDV